MAVEELRAGDLVATRNGGYLRVVWIGRQSFAGRFLRGQRGADGASGMPVRIRADALADGIPARNLLVSPDRSMPIDGFLVTARDLVNGVSVVQEEELGMVDYFHLDLGPHDCVLAEGAWSESYAEQHNRQAFHNAAEHPDPQPAFRTMCAEQATAGHPALPGILAAIVARLPAVALTDDPDLHLRVDGKRIDPVRAAGRETEFCVRLPAREMLLMSRAARPRRLGIGEDDRTLGYLVERLRVAAGEVRELHGGDPALGRGCHPAEGAQRWTKGAVSLPAGLFEGLAGEALLTVTGRGFDRYPADSAHPARMRAA